MALGINVYNINVHVMVACLYTKNSVKIVSDEATWTGYNVSM